MDNYEALVKMYGQWGNEVNVKQSYNLFKKEIEKSIKHFKIKQT